jgi:hypothetical protein
MTFMKFCLWVRKAFLWRRYMDTIIPEEYLYTISRIGYKYKTNHYTPYEVSFALCLTVYIRNDGAELRYAILSF